MVLTVFIMLYVAVSQLHPLMHHDSAPADLNRAVAVQAVGQTADAPTPETWRNRMDNHCPGDFSDERQAHHSCNCSMLQFTAQQRFESSILLAVNEVSFPPLDRIGTQYFPRGLNPPPRLS